MAGLPRAVLGDPGAEYFCDQIAWLTGGEKHWPVLALDAVAGGQVEFVRELQVEFVPELQAERTLRELSWHLSDHYLLWVEFGIPPS